MYDTLEVINLWAAIDWSYLMALDMHLCCAYFSSPTETYSTPFCGGSIYDRGNCIRVKLDLFFPSIMVLIQTMSDFCSHITLQENVLQTQTHANT